MRFERVIHDYPAVADILETQDLDADIPPRGFGIQMDHEFLLVLGHKAQRTFVPRCDKHGKFQRRAPGAMAYGHIAASGVAQDPARAQMIKRGPHSAEARMISHAQVFQLRQGGIAEKVTSE